MIGVLKHALAFGGLATATVSLFFEPFRPPVFLVGLGAWLAAVVIDEVWR